MTSQIPNPITRAETTTPFRASLHVHPDYSYWAPHWESIRDAEVGQVEVHRKGEKYLPKLASQDKKQYESYLKRSVFYNMTARTLNALYGTVFMRNPKVSGLTPELLERTKTITKDNTSLHIMAKTAVKEVLAVGRFGLLVDANPVEGSLPYVACYTAENIMDWEMSEIDGEWKLSRVLLREIFYDREDDTLWQPYEHKARFRVLHLEENETGGYTYHQDIYVSEIGATMPDVDVTPTARVTPRVRGRTLDYIPFTVVGPFTNQPDVEKPPMLDIVTLNYSHFVSYADLEISRFLVASPIYLVKLQSSESAPAFTMGPQSVWVMGKEDDASIMEMNGQGLRFLENALADKEAQIAAIGGRLMPGSARSASESDNSLLLKERNEQTLLLNISDTVDEAITRVLRWWADWSNVRRRDLLNILFEVNRDFKVNDIGARELRAIQMMYEAGVIPIDVVYENLRKAEVIPEWMDLEEFKSRLDDKEQFPNMVEVLARMRDFPDAQAYHEHKMMKAAPEVEMGPNDPDNIGGIPSQVRDARVAGNRNG